MKLHNEDGTVADYRFFIDVADWVASDWYTSDCCDVRVGNFNDVVTNTPPLPWWTPLLDFGVVVTIPAVSWGGGITRGVGQDWVWIPGEGWENYVYGEFGKGGEASLHIGVGIVVNIQNHEDYEGSYANVSVMVPTQYGSIGMDVSSWPGRPTAIEVIYGVGGGFSINYQFYRITEEAVTDLLDWIEEQEWFQEE